MPFTEKQQQLLEAALRYAADDPSRARSLADDPRGVMAREAAIEPGADESFRFLFASDAGFNIVLPPTVSDGNDSGPTVVLVGEALNDHEELNAILEPIRTELGDALERARTDDALRTRLVEDPGDVLGALGTPGGPGQAGAERGFRIVDPMAADVTVFLPRRDTDVEARPVLCMPGVDVFVVYEDKQELSDEALDAVAGGLGDDYKKYFNRKGEAGADISKALSKAAADISKAGMGGGGGGGFFDDDD